MSCPLHPPPLITTQLCLIQRISSLLLFKDYSTIAVRASPHLTQVGNIIRDMLARSQP